MATKKTKEQIVKETAQKQEILKHKQLALTKLVPAFTKADITIYQAGQLIDVLKNIAMGQMNGTWNEKPFKELGLLEELTNDETATDRELYGEILTALEDVPVPDVMKLLDIFGRIVEMYGHRQVMQARFKDLPIEELMEIK